jgi:hypothetical protein
VPRLAYDGAFIGPILPPPTSTASTDLPQPDRVSDAVLAIPHGTRQLVAQALDLLTRQDSGLRTASFYIGFIVLVSVVPVVILVGLGATLATPIFERGGGSSLDTPIVVAMAIAVGGYLAATVEARAIATAVIGGRAEGRPLTMRQAIAVARRRFWRLLGANIVVGLVAGLLSTLIELPLGFVFGNVQAINFGISLAIGTLVSAPFVYVPSGIILGEVGVFEAIQRSLGLAGARKQLAIVVALFGILSQFIVVFGVSIGADVVARIGEGAGILESFPPVLVIPLAAALVFAFGTLLFLVESITAAPAVFAFEALTHYTHGLQAGRDHPAAGSSIFSPWFSRPLALAAIVALLALGVGLVGMSAT